MAETFFLRFQKDEKKTFHQFIREANTNFVLFALCFALCALLFVLCSLLFALCALCFGFNSKAHGRDHRL
jgi:hypothetical protein